MGLSFSIPGEQESEGKWRGKKIQKRKEPQPTLHL